MPLTRVVPVLAVLVALLVALAPAKGADLPCYGAAARDALLPCSNPALDYSVFPLPADAVSGLNAPCQLVTTTPIHVCEFGTPIATARATIAVIGDSHAMAWRGAIDYAARAHGWHGVSLAGSGCALSAVIRVWRRPTMAACARWNRAVPAWLRRHPAVHTVIVAEYAGGVWRTRARVSAAAAVVRGYERGLARLPASVTHLIVIRDNPHATLHTAACVVRAMGSHQAPGPACALARSRTLAPDPLVEAAATLRSRSVQTVDLTPFFCDADRCFPVVGGVLVYKDDNHMTLAWSKTLGPYLLRALDRGASSRVGQDVRARTGPDSTRGTR